MNTKTKQTKKSKRSPSKMATNQRYCPLCKRDNPGHAYSFCPTLVCFNPECGETGHAKEFCHKMRCFVCAETGHTRKNCPKRRTRNSVYPRLARICRPLPRIQLRLPRIWPVVLCPVPGALAPREKWKAVQVPGVPQAPRERPVGHPESSHQSPP